MEIEKSCSNCNIFTTCKPCAESERFSNCDECTFEGKPCGPCDKWQPDYQILHSQLSTLQQELNTETNMRLDAEAATNGFKILLDEKEQSLSDSLQTISNLKATLEIKERALGVLGEMLSKHFVCNNKTVLVQDLIQFAISRATEKKEGE